MEQQNILSKFSEKLKKACAVTPESFGLIRQATILLNRFIAVFFVATVVYGLFHAGRYQLTISFLLYNFLVLLGIHGAIKNSSVCLVSSALSQITMFLAYLDYKPFKPDPVGGLIALGTLSLIIQASALRLQQAPKSDQQPPKQQQQQQLEQDTAANMA